jgi:hypothetical protein
MNERTPGTSIRWVWSRARQFEPPQLVTEITRLFGRRFGFTAAPEEKTPPRSNSGSNVTHRAYAG